MHNLQFSITNIQKYLINNKTILLFLLVVFIKQIAWMGIVPIWHFPDEQAHFAQVANVANFGIYKGLEGNRAATSDEIASSEKILGTFRDALGQNNYTFRPKYNIPYSDSYQGVWENQINQLPKEFTHQQNINEATVYPFLYYWLGSFAYKLGLQDTLINRVFLVRLISVLIFCLIIFPTYIIGKRIFKKRLPQFVFLCLVMFHPMFSFVGSGVTSDVLFNTIYAMFLSVGLLLIEKITLAKIVGLIVILLLGSISKQQMLIAYITTPFIFIMQWRNIFQFIKKHIKVSLIVLLLFFICILLVIKWGEFYRISGFITSGKYQGELNNLSLFDHIKWTLSHTYREILPWYWGIFKWLGVTLPRWANRIQMGLIVGSIIGNTYYLLIMVKKYWKQKKIEIQDKYIIFLYLASGIYFLCLMMWDFYFRRSYGFSFGMQGRYYFPVLISHMVFLIVGWKTIAKLLGKFIKNTFFAQKIIVTLLGIWWLVLHTIAVVTVGSSYYNLANITEFITQASQYKPLIFKGSWWYVWLGLSISGLLICFYTLLRLVFYEKKGKTTK